MRLILAVLLLSACDPAPATDTDILEIVHPCDAAAEDAFRRDDAWTPGDVVDCKSACDLGREQGWDAGRLDCIMDTAEPCLDRWCVVSPREGATPWNEGYRVCYAYAARGGYQDEGCIE